METIKQVLELFSRIPLWIDGLLAVFAFVTWLWKRRRKQPPSWRARIATQFRLEVELYGLYDDEPLIQEFGRFKLSPTLRRKADSFEKSLKAENKENQQLLALTGTVEDWKATPIVLPNIDWKAHRVTLPTEVLDFAAVKALREEGCRIPLLSANAVLVCPELNELILQCRSSHMDTFSKANPIHTIGGGYKHGYRGDQLKLSNTLKREIYEEAKLTVAPVTPPPMLLLGEIETGFVQLAFLGVSVSRHQVEHEMAHDDEGTLRRLKFADLQHALSTWYWVPTGKMSVLCWLALGAPGAGRRPTFDGQSPQQLFEGLVSQA